MTVLSAWVLLIFAGGWNDRGVAATTVDMPSESVCISAANKVAATKAGVNLTAVCINREASK